jgi:hypothetical protein
MINKLKEKGFINIEFIFMLIGFLLILSTFCLALSGFYLAFTVNIIIGLIILFVPPFQVLGIISGFLMLFWGYNLPQNILIAIQHIFH